MYVPDNLDLAREWLRQEDDYGLTEREKQIYQFKGGEIHVEDVQAERERTINESLSSL